MVTSLDECENAARRGSNPGPLECQARNIPHRKCAWDLRARCNRYNEAAKGKWLAAPNYTISADFSQQKARFLRGARLCTARSMFFSNNHELFVILVLKWELCLVLMFYSEPNKEKKLMHSFGL